MVLRYDFFHYVLLQNLHNARHKVAVHAVEVGLPFPGVEL
jgi:hypothetical protein